MYSIAEEKLLELKTPDAYDKWLVKVLKNAEITIVKDFLPKNLPNMDLSEGIHSKLQERSNPTDVVNAPDENKLAAPNK